MKWLVRHTACGEKWEAKKVRVLPSGEKKGPSWCSQCGGPIAPGDLEFLEEVRQSRRRRPGLTSQDDPAEPFYAPARYALTRQQVDLALRTGQLADLTELVRALGGSAQMSEAGESPPNPSVARVIGLGGSGARATPTPEKSKELRDTQQKRRKKTGPEQPEQSE